MGHQATVVFNLDHLHTLRNDPDLGKKLSDAIGRLALPKEYQDRDGGTRVNSQGATVAYAIESHHCDFDTLLVAGNLGAKVVSPVIFLKNDDMPLEEQVLRHLADEMGYYVARKPKRK